jgi:hypothetical protein
LPNVVESKFGLALVVGDGKDVELFRLSHAPSIFLF